MAKGTYFQVAAPVEITPGNPVTMLMRMGPFSSNSRAWFNRLYTEWPESERTELTLVEEPQELVPLPGMVDLRRDAPTARCRARSLIFELRKRYAKHVAAYADNCR